MLFERAGSAYAAFSPSNARVTRRAIELRFTCPELRNDEDTTAMQNKLRSEPRDK